MIGCIKYLRERLSEGSTHAALAAGLGTVSTQAPPDFARPLWFAVAFLTIMAVLLKDGGCKS
jgi:hypothetical protein